MSDRIEEVFDKFWNGLRGKVLQGMPRDEVKERFRAAVAEIQREERGKLLALVAAGEKLQRARDEAGEPTLDEAYAGVEFGHALFEVSKSLADQRDTQPYDEPTEKDIGPRSKRFQP